MIDRAYLPLFADRFVPFGVTLTFKGIDLTGKAMSAQVRKAVNYPTSALATLNVTTTVGGEGLRLVSVITNPDGSKSSVVELRISEATIRAMPTSALLDGSVEEDITFAWDLKIETTSGFYEIYCYGPFLLRAGVTQ